MAPADTVSYQVIGGGANGADFVGGVLPGGSVDFAAGEASKTITIEVQGDTDFEPDEAFTVELTGSAVGLDVAGASANGTIRNDDAAYRIVATDALKLEGDAGTTDFVFTVSRTAGAVSGADTISYATVPSGADPAEGSDFVGGFPNGVIAFAPGQVSQTLIIPVQGDTLIENDEGFTVNLGMPASGAPVIDGSADGLIINDDNETNGGGWGEPHYYTFDGLHYDFQGVGEYVLLRSTALHSDDIEVQVRTKAYGSSRYVSAHSAVATVVEGTRISIDNDRASPVFIDGVAAVLNSPLDLGNGASIAQNGGTYTITYANNDELEVFDRGSYLDVRYTVRSAIVEGMFEGILGDLDGNASNDIQLADGTVLGTSPTADELYGAGGFGDSWRISDATSLFDYPAGLGTADFTDLTFPGAIASLANFPADLVDAALAQVAANGITDPTVQEAAALDLLLGGPQFQQSFADGTGPSNPTAVADDTDSGPAPTVIGAIAPLTAVSEGDAGTTSFTFDVFRSGDLSAPLSLSYTVGGTVDAADFGGTLPSGTVDFAAGQDTVQVTLNVSGDTAVEADETVELHLSGLPVDAVLGTLGQGILANDDASLSISALNAVQTEGGLPGVGGSGGLAGTSGDVGGTGGVTLSPSVKGKKWDGGGWGEPHYYTIDGLHYDFQGVGEFVLLRSTDVAGFDHEVQVRTQPHGSSRSVSSHSAVATEVEGVRISIDNDRASPLFVDGVAVNPDVATPFTFTVARQGDASAVQTVDYAVTGNGADAADADDFVGGVLPFGTVTLNPGEASKTLTVWVRGDGDVEPDEGFQVQLSNASDGSPIGTTTAVGTILDDDANPPVGGGGSGQGAIFVDLGNGASVEANINGSRGNYAITYANGHVLEVFDRGGYLDVRYSGADDIVSGAFEGILGNADEDPTNDIQLADGTVLGTNPTKEQLYEPGGFADSWRISDATSLFDYPDGLGTADFTDLTFPGYVASLRNFPGDLVSQALAQAEANGVTDPVLREAAALDLLLGGPEFEQSFAAGSEPGAVQESAEVMDSTPPAVIIGATAPMSAIAEGDAGTTPVKFTAYRTGDLSAAASVDYTLAGTVDAADFGGTLPSGTIDFAAGEDMVDVILNLAGDTDVEADETVQLVLANLPAGAVLGALGQASILNDDAAAPANTAPTVTSDAMAAVLEGVTTVFYTATATDPEGDTVTFALGGADAALFDFDTQSGELNFAAGPDRQMPADADGDNVYALQIVGSDGDLEDTLDFSVTVNADTDRDGIANRFDPDFDNNNFVGPEDVGYLVANFGTADPLADLDSNGIVGPEDIQILVGLFGQAPGEPDMG